MGRLSLYWSIGRTILQQQEQEGWGAKVIECLSKDLGKEFPGIGGFSSRNLKYMRKFADLYPDFQIVQQLAAQIPWWHKNGIRPDNLTFSDKECEANRN